MPNHKWSGWPGAVCLICGAEDQIEYCVAIDCPNAFVACECSEGCGLCSGTGVLPGHCEEHRNNECLGYSKDEEPCSHCGSMFCFESLNGGPLKCGLTGKLIK